MKELSTMENQAISTAAADPPKSPRRMEGGVLGPGLILAGCLLSVGAAMWGYQQARGEAIADFNRKSSDRAHVIEHKIQDDIYEKFDGLKAFYLSSHQVDREEFRIFTARYDQVHSDLEAVLWIPRISARNRLAFEDELQDAGFSKGIFDLGTKNKNELLPVPPSENYLAVQYVTPAEKHQAFPGFNVMSHAGLARALNKSIQSGRVIASEKVTLPPALRLQNNVWFFYTVYEKGSSSDAVKGVLAIVPDMTKLVDEALEALDPGGVHFAIYDISSAASKNLISLH